MAAVKISYSVLERQKGEYVKAVKNMRQVMESIKKINNSLGSDRMLQGARDSLTKLYTLLEARATAVEMMAGSMDEAVKGYQSAVSKAVKRSNEFRAHKKDFYGNPVVVNVITGDKGSSLGATSTPASPIAATEALSGNSAQDGNNITINQTTINVTQTAQDPTMTGMGNDILSVNEKLSGGMEDMVRTSVSTGGDFGDVSELSKVFVVEKSGLGDISAATVNGIGAAVLGAAAGAAAGLSVNNRNNKKAEKEDHKKADMETGKEDFTGSDKASGKKYDAEISGEAETCEISIIENEGTVENKEINEEIYELDKKLNEARQRLKQMEEE